MRRKCFLQAACGPKKPPEIIQDTLYATCEPTPEQKKKASLLNWTPINLLFHILSALILAAGQSEDGI